MVFITPFYHKSVKPVKTKWGTFFATSYISDGLSNTVAFSELIAAPSRGTSQVKGGFYVNGGMNNSYTVRPSVCMDNARVPGSRNMLNNPAQGVGRGEMYAHAAITYNGFNTALPPNAPACLPVDAEIVWGFYSAQSNHPGGVNISRADGSVSFVSETIDCGGLPDHLQGTTLSGKSAFGVWGALGTPAGSESSSL